MLALSPETVCFIIVKARAFDAKEGIVESDPGSNASDEGMRSVLEDYADDPVFEELKSAIDDLNVEVQPGQTVAIVGQQICLVALAWLGRGTYDAGEWQEALAEARRDHNDRTAEYLLGMPMLGDYLEEGLSALGYSCEEFETGHL